PAGVARPPRARTPVRARASAKLLFRVRFPDGTRNGSFAEGIPEQEFGNEGITGVRERGSVGNAVGGLVTPAVLHFPPNFRGAYAIIEEVRPQPAPPTPASANFHGDRDDGGRRDRDGRPSVAARP